MSKSVQEYEPYEFSLSKELDEMAAAELREDAGTREFALNGLREWLEANDRISSIRMGMILLIIFEIA